MKPQAHVSITRDGWLMWYWEVTWPDGTSISSWSFTSYLASQAVVRAVKRHETKRDRYDYDIDDTTCA